MSIMLRDITIGAGIPKIAVPIISRRREDILAEAAAIAGSCADIAEWRADHYEDMRDTEKTASLAAEIRKILGGKLLLFTCRTAKEGGAADISEAEYRDLLFEMIGKGSADLIDAELAQSESFIEELVRTAHSAGKYVVASYHNFAETPDEAALLGKYGEMNERGADILKIAVMPNCDGDTDRMMCVSRAAAGRFGRPIIAIVMGERGRCTRIVCEAIDSCLTFGTIGGESAPGQITAEKLSEMLGKVHENIDAFRAAEDSAAMNVAIGKYC